MGGSIGADSVFGEGSTFWFELPLTPLSDSPHLRTYAGAGTGGLIGARTRQPDRRHLPIRCRSDPVEIDPALSDLERVFDLLLVSAELRTRCLRRFPAM